MYGKDYQEIYKRSKGQRGEGAYFEETIYKEKDESYIAVVRLSNYSEPAEGAFTTTSYESSFSLTPEQVTKATGVSDLRYLCDSMASNSKRFTSL